MSAIVGIQVTILFIPKNSTQITLDTEVCEIEVLAPSIEIEDWAKEELACQGNEIIIGRMEREKYLAGVYTAIGLFKLTGGIEPDYNGEYWSDMEAISDIHFTKLRKEQLEKESLDGFSDNQLEVLFDDRAYF